MNQTESIVSIHVYMIYVKRSVARLTNDIVFVQALKRGERVEDSRLVPYPISPLQDRD